MAKKKGLKLALRIFLSGLTASVPGILHATESKTDNLEKIASFEYESPRYKGVVHEYHLWFDGKEVYISRADNPNIKFKKRGWFYDIDNDGKFGKAEIDQIKSENLIHMHPEFNKIVNKIADKEIAKALEDLGGLKEQYEEQVRNLEEEFEKRKDLDETSAEEIKRKEPRLSIILGARGGIPGFLGSNGLYGGELGVKYGRFALVGNISGRPNKNIENIEEELINNVYFQGKEDLKDFLSVGASFEYHHPISPRLSQVVGIGGNVENYTKEGEATLVKRTNQGDSIINSNTQSSSEKEFVGRIYTGPSFKITDWLRLNSNIGYEAAFKDQELKGRGAYANLRAILSVPNKYKGNR